MVKAHADWVLVVIWSKEQAKSPLRDAKEGQESPARGDLHSPRRLLLNPTQPLFHRLWVKAGTFCVMGPGVDCAVGKCRLNPSPLQAQGPGVSPLSSVGLNVLSYEMAVIAATTFNPGKGQTVSLLAYSVSLTSTQVSQGAVWTGIPSQRRDSLGRSWVSAYVEILGQVPCQPQTFSLWPGGTLTGCGEKKPNTGDSNQDVPGTAAFTQGAVIVSELCTRPCAKSRRGWIQIRKTYLSFRKHMQVGCSPSWVLRN